MHLNITYTTLESIKITLSIKVEWFKIFRHFAFNYMAIRGTRDIENIGNWKDTCDKIGLKLKYNLNY